MSFITNLNKHLPNLVGFRLDSMEFTITEGAGKSLAKVTFSVRQEVPRDTLLKNTQEVLTKILKSAGVPPESTTIKLTNVVRAPKELRPEITIEAPTDEMATISQWWDEHKHKLPRTYFEVLEEPAPVEKRPESPQDPMAATISTMIKPIYSDRILNAWNTITKNPKNRNTEIMSRFAENIPAAAFKDGETIKSFRKELGTNIRL